MEPYHIAQDCVDKWGLSYQRKHHPALIAIRQDRTESRFTELNYQNVRGLSHRLANFFQQQGLKPGERVILRLYNGPEFPIAFIAALKAGLIPIPTSAQLTAAELQFILQDSDAQALVCDQDLLPEQGIDALRCILVVGTEERQKPYYRWATALTQSATEYDYNLVTPNAPAYWLYTSGTEGQPKAVIHAHRSIPAHDARLKQWLDLKPRDRVFNTSALNWSYALTGGLLDIWRHGAAAITYQGPLEAAALTQVLQQCQVTTLMSVPGIYRRLIEYWEKENIHCPKLRIAVSAGESLSPELRERFAKHTGVTIHEGLGMTEHSVYLVQPQGQPIVPSTCGRALEPEHVAILDEETLQPVPSNTVGILASHRSCPGLMLGYHQRPELEQQCWAEDWFLSGDLASMDEQGNVQFIGRRDDVITAGGYRISPMEIEAVFASHPQIAECAAIAQQTPEGKSFLSVMLVPTTTLSTTTAQETLLTELKTLAQQQLAPYKQPRAYLWSSALPRSSNGKLQRQRLRE